MGSASDDAAVLADLAQLKLDEARSVQAAGVHATACSARPLAEPPRPRCPGRRATLREHRSFSAERWRRGSSRTSSRQPRTAVQRQRRRTKPTAGKVRRLQACSCAAQHVCQTGFGACPFPRVAEANVPSFRSLFAAWDEDAVPLPPQPAPAAKGNGADSWEAAAAPPRPSTRSRPAAAPAAAVAAADGGEAAETLAFGGGHVLEFFDLTPAVRTQHLEAFLERLCSGHAAPPTLK